MTFNPINHFIHAFVAQPNKTEIFITDKNVWVPVKHHIFKNNISSNFNIVGNGLKPTTNGMYTVNFSIHCGTDKKSNSHIQFGFGTNKVPPTYPIATGHPVSIVLNTHTTGNGIYFFKENEQVILWVKNKLNTNNILLFDGSITIHFLRLN